tara:strand:+ start:43 stop:1029 length:987 start_codon:yes stop_codon:yes gene_type:complete
MLKLIQDFPNHIKEGIEIANQTNFTNTKNNIQNVILCGMGGSGIGAKIVSDWVRSEANVPVTLVSDYFLPDFVSENTLVIASSYSGNTEETMQALETADSKKANIVCICSGGKMEVFCSEKKYDAIIVPSGKPPRSALAFSIVQILNVLSAYNVITSNKIVPLLASSELLRNNVEAIKKTGNDLAEFLFNKVGVFYSEPQHEGVIVRARQQVNENSKYLAWHHIIPEMNHNELVGWGGGDKRFAPVFFETDDVYFRNEVRYNISKKAIQEKCDEIFIVKSKGVSLIEKAMYFVHVIDWSSYYLSELNNADIIDISIIDHLKSELSKVK